MRRIGFITLSVLLLAAILYYVLTSLTADSSANSPVSSGELEEIESGADKAGGQSVGSGKNGGGSQDDQGAVDKPEQTDGDLAPEHKAGPAAPIIPVIQQEGRSVAVTTEPAHVAVLVNKQIALPIDYKPEDLVYPDVPFTFDEKVEKRMLREVAADALKRMFDAAAKDGIKLAGVSGYRSGATQKSLFERYAKRDGEEAANRYSARAGHSEHQTGLAIDVSGIDGKCAVVDCFGDTDEARWIAEFAHEHGFIIRYPEGKEDITGYKYEPWHIRYVGVEIATHLYENELTMEEYYGAAVPVSN